MNDVARLGGYQFAFEFLEVLFRVFIWRLPGPAELPVRPAPPHV